MRLLIWAMTVFVTVYWLPRIFLSYVVPLACSCKPVEVLPSIYKVMGLRSAVKNTYIVTGPNLTIIDPGLFYQRRCIEKALRSLGYSLRDVDYIVASHYHIDHAGGIGSIREASNAKVIAHALDRPIIEGLERHTYPHAPPLLRLGLGLVHILLHDYVSPVDITVQGGDSLDVLGGLKVIHSPGHTPGSISLYSEKLRLLFSGDAIQHFDGTVRRAKVIYSHDLAEDVQSIERLSLLEFDCMLVGDGQPLLGGASTAVRAYASSLR